MAEPGTTQAFAPGHATGFFGVETGRAQDDANGSIGAGVCLELGALAQAEVAPGDGQVAVEGTGAAGEPIDEMPVTQTAVAWLVGDRDLDVEVAVQLQLPVGQGLGMSGAGALSAALAVAPHVDGGRLEAVRAAHRAELSHLTGLGDVAAQIQGGVVVRRAAGIPPYGAASTIPGRPQMVLATLGDPIDVPDVLSDPDRVEHVTALGRQGLKHLLQSPSVERFFDVSRAFAEQSGLVDDRVAEVLDRVGEHGPATVAMIGSTIVATGDLPAIEKVLADHADPRRIQVADRGAGRIRT